MPGSNEWGQFYHENFLDGEQTATTILPVNSGGFSEATIVTTTSTVVTESVSSPCGSYSGGQLTPTGSVAKPIRRRSRVSKKTPITLLNANANNFRALVQQFTGCDTSSSPISFGTQKGPINLSFGPNTVPNSSLNAPFGSHNYSYQYQQQLQRLAQPQLQVQQQPRQPLLQLPENQEFHQEQQRMYPIDNASGNGHDVFQHSSSSASGNHNPAPSMEQVMDGTFIMDQEDIALHEFSRDLFSN